MLTSVVQDMRYAFKLLAAQRGFTAAALLTLALGIGGSTAIFTAADAVVLDSLPYTDAERLVVVWERAPNGNRNTASPAAFADGRGSAFRARRREPVEQLRAHGDRCPTAGARSFRDASVLRGVRCRSRQRPPLHRR